MRARRRDSAAGPGTADHDAPAGKRTRTQSLATRSAGRADSAQTDANVVDGEQDGAAPAVGADGGAYAHDDPFGMHLIGQPANPEEAGAGAEAPSAAREVSEDDAPKADGADAAADAEAPDAGSDTDQNGTDAPSDDSSTDSAADEPAAGEAVAGEAATGDSAASSEPVDLASSGSNAEPAAPEPDSTPAPANAAAELSSTTAAQIQAGVIQSAAAAESQKALTTIAQREQMVRGTFAQQRAAIQNIGTTQAALARSEAKAAAGRIRGGNGSVATTIRQTVDSEVTRLSLATQDAMRRCTAASRVVTSAVGPAADGALANANLDFSDAVEGQLANDLYQRLIPEARKAVRDAAHDARDRDVNALATARDRNARALRNAGDMIAHQVDAKLPELERSMIAAGDKLAVVFERNAQSQLRALDASERAAASFFTRARSAAQRLVDAGRATAGALTAAAAGQPGGSAHFEAAAAQARAQLAERRERLTSEVDGVANRTVGEVSNGAAGFASECSIQRGIAQGNHAAIENKLITDIAVKMTLVRAEVGKDVDLAIISANSYAAAAESNSAAVASQLPSRFAGMMRSAFADALKSRTRRRLEGMWGALKGIAIGLAKMVAAGLIIMFAPLAFGIAALLGKAGTLAGIVRDAAMAIVGMVDAFAERFRTLFRTWDEWPWYVKVTAFLATGAVAIGDLIGLPLVVEGITGRELMSNRELSDHERGEKMAGGGFATVASLAPAALLERRIAAAQAKVGASAAAVEAGAVTPESLVAKVDDAAELAAAKPGVDDVATVADDSAMTSAVVLEGADDIASYARAVPRQPGTLDVFVHGSVDEFIVIGPDGGQITLSHRSLATYIEKQGIAYERIRLISCKTGAHAKGAAQHLANKLNVVVEAPTDLVHIRPDGSLVVGPFDHVPSGRWETFSPRPAELRYTAAKEPAPPSVRDRARRRRQETEAATVEDDGVSPREAAEASTDSKALGHRDNSPESSAARDLTPAGPDLARRAETIDKLAELEVEHVQRGTIPDLEHDTYFLTPADGARMAELIRIIEPDLPVRLNSRELLIGGGADAWYFVLDERAGKLGGQRAPAVLASEGGFGLPPSNVSTADMLAMRGIRTIKKAGDDHARGPTEWTPEEAAEVSGVTARQPLLHSGHVGVSVDRGATAHGWQPAIPASMADELAKLWERLKNHEAFPGVMRDDTQAFAVGEAGAEHAGWNTRVARVPELLEKEQHRAIVEQVRRLEDSPPQEHGLGYSLPLEAPDAVGNHFAASNGFAAEVVRNCAAFLETLGLKIPEPSGNMKAFMEALDAWEAPDAPIVDARPKRGAK